MDKYYRISTENVCQSTVCKYFMCRIHVHTLIISPGRVNDGEKYFTGIFLKVPHAYYVLPIACMKLQYMHTNCLRTELRGEWESVK